MNNDEQGKSIGAVIAETFNHIFYEKRLKHSANLTLEQNLLASYLADDIRPDIISTEHYARAVFASFAKKYLHNRKTVDSLLRLGTPSTKFCGDINTDPLIIYCIDNMDYPRSAEFNKIQVSRDPLHDIEPNISAIMAGSVYKAMFRNKNLLKLVRKARDGRDLKALLFIDYMFRSTRDKAVQRILCDGFCVEYKALRLARLVKRRYVSALQQQEQAMKEREMRRQYQEKQAYTPIPLLKKTEEKQEKKCPAPVELKSVDIHQYHLQLKPVELPQPPVLSKDYGPKFSRTRRSVQQSVVSQEVYERQSRGLLAKISMSLHSKRRALALAAGIAVYLGFPV